MVLTGADQLGISPYRDPAQILALLREANQDCADYQAGGFVWLFRLCDSFGDPCLAVGIRGEVGALVWYAKPGMFVPVNGTNRDYADYWTWFGHEAPMRPGSEVPIDQVYAALDELIRTQQRPTCVQWRSVG
ncbi:MAG TPA: Imm1 family immunity protein [Pseudonocardiaceae bacterium]|jgi:hypothetical protein|nr:Imm1 family immunity protein [Pseudonocardiaceae bacterium]